MISFNTKLQDFKRSRACYDSLRAAKSCFQSHALCLFLFLPASAILDISSFPCRSLTPGILLLTACTVTSADALGSVFSDPAFLGSVFISCSFCGPAESVSLLIKGHLITMELSRALRLSLSKVRLPIEIQIYLVPCNTIHSSWIQLIVKTRHLQRAWIQDVLHKASLLGYSKLASECSTCVDSRLLLIAVHQNITWLFRLGLICIAPLLPKLCQQDFSRRGSHLVKPLCRRQFQGSPLWYQHCKSRSCCKAIAPCKMLNSILDLLIL